jgi:hypothetical protein
LRHQQRAQEQFGGERHDGESRGAG